MLDLAAIKTQASIIKVAEASGLSLTRDSDNEFKCQCVFHDDRSPSLSFTVSTNLYFCFGCGACGSAIDFVAKYYDLGFMDAAIRTAELAGLSAADINMEPKLVDTAIFTDEKGNPLYGEHRYEPGYDGKKKSFTQFHYQDGQEIPNLPPRIRRVLYNLPAVIASDVVFLVEGKKDVDTLAAWDFVGTTKTSGGRGDWYREYTETLINKTVIILPDQEAGDKPGASYARKVSLALNGKAKSVLVVNVPRGKDITQFKELGGTKEDLIALIDKANQPENSPTKKTQEILRKRGMPEAVESERLILGALLRGQVSFDEVAMLAHDDFTQANHSRIFLCMFDIFEAGGSLDTLAVGQALKQAGNDLTEYLSELAAEVPPLYQFDWHLQAIVKASGARRLIATAMKAVDGVLLGGGVDEARARLVEAQEMSIQVDSNAPRMEQLMDGASLDELFSKQEMGIRSYIEPLDEETYGFRKAQFSVIAARPGQGKTSLVTQIGAFAARDGYNVDMISLEMPKKKVTARIICQMSGLDSRRVMSGKIDAEERALIAEVAGKLAAVPFHIDDKPDWNSFLIRQHLKRRKMMGQAVDLLIIDYLQLLRLPGRLERKDELGQMTRELKLMSNEFECHICALSQLNREGVKLNRKPQLEDLRESGTIEQDADTVLMIWQDQSDQGRETREGEILIPKQRDGDSGGSVKINFWKGSTYFEARM